MAGDREKLSTVAADKLRKARRMKSWFELDIREAYFFAAPWRARSISSQVVVNIMPRPLDDAELQTAIAMEESENFSTTLINSFMPPGEKWVNLEPSFFVPQDARANMKKTADADRDVVFSLIEQSNLYPEMPKTLNPDAAVGTFAIMIQDGPQMHKPVRVLGIPLHQLEIDIGPDGNVDARFVVKHVLNKDVKALLPDLTLDADIERDLAADPDKHTELRWGWWRMWDRTDEVVYQHVIMMKEIVVHDEIFEGEGSCELLPIRFNPLPEYAYGIGPLLKALPELRILDDMSAAEIENIDLTMRPPMSYPDDSFANVEQGVETGGWYPIRPGTENAIKKMYEPNKLDAAYFAQTARERRIKRMFYNDFPEQRGDTPPTATQWVDEMSMAQRKIGTPGLAFWREGPRAVFLRFMYIARKRGLLASDQKAISLSPYNPTKQAQDQQKVSLATRAAQIGAGLFPEEFKAMVDGTETIKNINDLMDVNSVIKMRPASQVKAAIAQIAQLQAGSQGGQIQPPQPGQPGAMPPPAAMVSAAKGG